MIKLERLQRIVWYWHVRDIPTSTVNVCSLGHTGSPISARSGPLMTRSGPGLETADRAGSCCLGTQKLDDLGSLRGFVRNEFAKPQWACPQPVCPLNRQRRPRCSRSTNPNLRAGFRQLGHPSNACDRHRGARPGPGANKRDGSSAIIDLKRYPRGRPSRQRQRRRKNTDSFRSSDLQPHPVGIWPACSAEAFSSCFGGRVN
jgi:hypothetical protein